MMSIRRLFLLTMMLCLLAVGLLSSFPTVAGCTSDLLDCYQEAAEYPTFLTRAAAGLDCEIAFVGCVRNEIIGV